MITSCFAGEVVKFNDDKPIEEMLKVVKSELKKGEAKAMIFSTGEFHLIRPAEDHGGDQHLTELAGPLSVELADNESLETIKKWCNANKVKWVYLRLDLGIKSKLFFKLEEQLRSSGIQYLLSSVDAKKDGIITLNNIPGAPTVPTIPN